MKLKIALLFLFFLQISFGQTIDHLQFDYDASGNQIRRYAIDLIAGRTSSPKNLNDLLESDLKKADIYDDIMYYPNPVKEELFVQWKNTDANYVNQVEVYTMSGQLMRTYSESKDTNSSVISFQTYPEGFYNLILIYSTGEKKALKIIKK